MGVRDAVALQAGVDDQVLSLVDHYEESTLSPQQKAALRFADAYLQGPRQIDESLRAELLEFLTPAQLGALLLRLMHFSSDKVMVALGLDLPEARIQIM